MDLKPGDIILVRGKGLLPQLIRFFMNIYRKRLGLSKRTLFNHAGDIVKIWGEIHVAESTGNGVEVRPFSKIYGNKLNKIKILRFKEELNTKEQNKLSKSAIGYSLVPTRYNFLNFIFQIEKILTTTNNKIGKWFGVKGKKAENRLYCSEAVAVWSNSVRKDTFNDPWSINPLDIDINESFVTVYDGTK